VSAVEKAGAQQAKELLGISHFMILAAHFGWNL
jgi:hypothetical protein